MASDLAGKLSQTQQHAVAEIVSAGIAVGLDLKGIAALVSLANIETDLGVNLSNPTSTAFGLFQTTDPTWFGVLDPTNPDESTKWTGKWEATVAALISEGISISSTTTGRQLTSMSAWEARNDITAQAVAGAVRAKKWFNEGIKPSLTAALKANLPVTRAESLDVQAVAANRGVTRGRLFAETLDVIAQGLTPTNVAGATKIAYGAVETRVSEISGFSNLTDILPDPFSVPASDLLTQAASVGSMFSYSYNPETIGNFEPDDQIEGSPIEIEKGQFDPESQPAADGVQFAQADNLNTPYREIAVAIASSVADVMYYPEARKRAARKIARTGSRAMGETVTGTDAASGTSLNSSGDEPESQSPDGAPASIEAMDWDYIATEVDALAKRIEAEITPPPPGVPDRLAPHSIRLSADLLPRDTGMI